MILLIHYKINTERVHIQKLPKWLKDSSNATDAKLGCSSLDSFNSWSTNESIWTDSNSCSNWSHSLKSSLLIIWVIFEELALAADADLDYLDALVQHDYGRLCRLQSDSESVSSIFSEILENEQKSNSNYQDDIFNKNIELIFNSDVDLDDCEWEVIERAENKPLAANLDEAIDQLKQSSVLKEPTDKGLTIEHKQASLDAFYSEQKKEEIKSKDVFVSDENQGKINNRVQAKTFNKSILMVGIIVLAVLIYFILQ